MQQFDVAVIGGGLVGASFARAIAATGLSIAVIDRAAATELYTSALDNRGLAISYTTKAILSDLKIWDQLAPNAYAINEIHVSEQASFGFTKLTAEKAKLPALGYVLAASHVGAAIIHGLDDLQGLTMFRPEVITRIEYNVANECWQIDLQSQKLQAKLLIAADGSNSTIHQQYDFSIYTKDYAQVALVSNITLDSPVKPVAYERFTAQGVLALLPFGKQQLKCVYTIANAELGRFKQMQSQEFLLHIQNAIGFRVGKLIAVDDRKSFPVVHSYAEKILGPACVLIGNAANTLHPVAAQGFNLGIRDAVALAYVLRMAKKSGKAINSISTLEHYAQLRALDHQKTRQFSNRVVEIFAYEQPLIKASRGLGLFAAQMLPQIKSKILANGLGTWM